MSLIRNALAVVLALAATAASAASHVVTGSERVDGVLAYDYVWLLGGQLSGVGTISGSVAGTVSGWENYVAPGDNTGFVSVYFPAGAIGTLTTGGSLSLSPFGNLRAELAADGFPLGAPISSYFEISKAGAVLASDKVMVGQALTYGGPLYVTLAPGSGPVASFAAGDQWDLYDFGSRYGSTVFSNDALFGTSGSGGTVLGLPQLTADLVWRFNYGAGVLYIDPVPEPATYMLLGLGLAGISGLAARRRTLARAKGQASSDRGV